MGKLKLYNLESEWLNDKPTHDDSTVSYVLDSKEAKFQENGGYFKAIYNVTSTTSSTRLIGMASGTQTCLNDIHTMFVDGVELSQPEMSITFDTLGLHRVTCVMKKDTKTYRGLFCDLPNLVSVDLSKLNTSTVTNMSYMFYNCSGLTSLDVSNFDTSQVTDMSHMFSFCRSLTSLDVSNFDTSHVTSMSSMCSYCGKLTSLDLSNWNTSNVTSMNNMFTSCYTLTSLDLSNFYTSNVTNMEGMFASCNALTSLDLSNWNTSNVTSMSSMFANCNSLTSLDLSNFDTSNVTSMYSMFRYCYSLTSLDVSNFDTSNVTDMRAMFDDCEGLTSLDVSSWDISNVMVNDNNNYDQNNLSWMFKGCNKLTHFKFFKKTSPIAISFASSYLNYNDNCNGKGVGLNYVTHIDLSAWDTSNIVSMSNLFKACYDLSSMTQVIGFENLNTSNVTDMSGMFSYCYDLTSLDLSNLDISNVTNVSKMCMACNQLTSFTFGSNTDVSKITSCESMFNSVTTNGIFYYNSEYDYSKIINVLPTTWKVQDSNASNYLIATYNVTITSATTQLLGSSFDLSQVTELYINDTPRTITNAYRFTSTGTYEIKMVMSRNVTNLADMFNYCSGLTSLDLSNFNTSKVTDMNYMFNGCSGLTSLDLSNFDTSKVTDMRDMFQNCKKLTSVTFSENFGSACVDMSYMFNYCSGLTSLDLSNFDTSNVTNMGNMFSKCMGLTSLDISNFDTSNVTDIGNMFYYCTKLKTLKTSNFKTCVEYGTSDAFTNASALTTVYHDGLADSSWAILCKTSSYIGSAEFIPALKTFDEEPYLNYTISIAKTRTDIRILGIRGITSHLEISSGNEIVSSTSLTYNFSSASTYNVTLYKPTDLSFKSTKSMFDGCSGLTSLDVSSFDTSNVTYMDNMFRHCSGLTSLNLSNFDTSKVTNMRSMFNDCKGLTSLDLSNFNTSAVTDMGYMFNSCSGLTSLNVSNFDTSNVTTMAYMFDNCIRLTSLDVSNFETRNVTDMSFMFYGCSGLTSLDLSDFYTPQVLSMENMFSMCRISSMTINASSAINLYRMFYKCPNLTEVGILGLYDADDLDEMFYDCTSLQTVMFYAEPLAVTTATDMFAGVKSGGTFYCFPSYTSDLVLDQVPSSWTITEF